jgi:hypothetical protein
MASASVVSNTNKENTLNFDSFNYKEAFSDELSIASSTNYMTPIDDQSRTESDPE